MYDISFIQTVNIHEPTYLIIEDLKVCLFLLIHLPLNKTNYELSFNSKLTHNSYNYFLNFKTINSSLWNLVLKL